MNKNKIKHWHLVKSQSFESTMYLSHQPPGANKEYGHPCTRGDKKNSRWYCTVCGKYAPREISFIADLARCYRHQIEPL